MSDHTPGPWKVIGSLRDTPITIITEEGTIEKEDYIEIGTADTWCGRAEANARLMAAAPELLEVLRELHDEQNGPPLLGRHEKSWRDVMTRVKKLLNELGG